MSHPSRSFPSALLRGESSCFLGGRPICSTDMYASKNGRILRAMHRSWDGGEVVTCLGRWKTVLCDMVLAAPLLLLLLRCLGAVFASLVWQTKSIWGLKKGEDVFFCTLVVPSP